MKGDAGMFLMEEDGVHAVTFMEFGETYVDETTGVLTLDLLIEVEALDGEED